MKRFYLLAMSIVVLVVLTFAYWSIFTRAVSAENALEASYQRGFYNLQDQVEDIGILLSKTLGTSSKPLQVMTLTSVWHISESAKESLSSLPLGKQDMMSSQKFFAQLGDYSYCLCKRMVADEDIGAEEWGNLGALKSTITYLGRELNDLKPGELGKIEWENKKTSGMAESFSDITERLKGEAPSLTYDGPFSDHVENIKPKGLSGDKIDSVRARELALKWAKIISDDVYDAQVVRKVKGLIPAFHASLTSDGAPEIIMDISEKGGHLLWFLNLRRVNTDQIEIKKALELAQEFLNQWDLGDMEITGTVRDGNVITVTFVPLQDDVLLYPDYVKVLVALDNGDILGLDSVEYRKSHVVRDFPNEKISEEKALDVLKPEHQVNRVRQAVIPSPGHDELLCFEVDVTIDNERFFIYVDTRTGVEQEILKIIQTHRGTMTL